MTTLCRSHTDEGDAHRSIERLLAAGVPADDIRLLMGQRRKDASDAPRGSFAEGVGSPATPVGTFAGAPASPRDQMGDFAGQGGHGRRGSFGDVDRDTVTTGLGADIERVHIASHSALRRLLMDAGLDGATADRDVAALHEGRILVLVETTEIKAGVVASALDGHG